MRLVPRLAWPALLLLIAACGEDPVSPRPTATVLVSDLLTGAPIAGIKVVAMNGPANLPVAGPQRSDEQGRVEFDFPAAPDLRYLVVPGLDWVVHFQDDWYPPATGTSGPTPNRILLRPAVPADGLPRIAGRVVDAMTGDPLDLAFIGAVPQLAAYSGRSSAGADVTESDGRFSVQEIAFATHPITGNLSQLEPLFVSRAGYRPQAWFHHPANGDNNLDISGVTIALEPVGAGDTGVLTGRVLRQGLPVADLPVGLGGIARGEKSGFGLPGQVTRTDEAGRFRFAGLAAGSYVIHPGYMLRDESYYPLQDRPPSVAVGPDASTDAGDLAVWWEIEPEKGINAVVSRAQSVLDLSWQAAPGAESYQVFINGFLAAETIENVLAWEIPADFPAGWHQWRVIARDSRGNPMAAMQLPIWWNLLD